MPSRRARGLRRTVAALFALATGACAAPYRETIERPVLAGADTLSRQQRADIVDALDRTIRLDFAHWAGTPGLDYPVLAAHYRLDALAESDRRRFDFLTLAFLASLKNGHTDFDDDWLWAHDGAALGFRLRWAEDRWVVAWSRVPGLDAGAVVDSIDGEPFERFFARQRRYVSSSTERGARYLFATRAYLYPRRFVLSLASGARVPVVRGLARLGAPGDPDDALPEVARRWLVPDSVAYLRIPCFNDPAYEEEALRALRTEYRRASGVILDVRGNCGGASPLALVGAFADRPFPWWSQYDAVNGSLVPGPWSGDRPELDEIGRPLAQRPARPYLRRAGRELRQRLVILADEGCASACEDFVMPLKWIGRALVVGDTTYGSSGQPRMLDFGEGMTARVSTRREYFPDGSAFEGIGIAPDLRVPVTASALRDRRDAALQVALDMLRPRTVAHVDGPPPTPSHGGSQR